jgi:threonine synthase
MTVLRDRLDFGPASALACRSCGARYDIGPQHACEACFGPLEVAYDQAAMARVVRADIESGPATMWRYAPLLPAPPPQLRVDLGVGCTRLVRADNLARELGMRSLYVKEETANPTHSFKDRVVGLAASAARAMGYRVLACASTGNLANAVAAAGARAGMGTVVLIPADLEPAKVMMTAVFGAKLVAVDGSYDEVNRLCVELAEEFEDWAFVNVNVRPFYAEGSKTLGFEIAEQLGWRLPRQVVVPIASGSLLTKVDKAWGELAAAGLVEPSPYSVFGAQSAGCAPVSNAFKAGLETVRPVKAAGIVKSLAIGNPADGPYALDVVRRTGGVVEDVEDGEVVEGIHLLARTEGLFAETAGGVTVATLRKLLDAGQLDPAAETVLLSTGDGLKTLDALAGTVDRPAPIAPTLPAFLAAGLV